MTDTKSITFRLRVAIGSRTFRARMKLVPPAKWLLDRVCQHNFCELIDAKDGTTLELCSFCGMLVGVIGADELHPSLEDDIGVDVRQCDECGRVTDAGEWPDWINGVCERCDPSILEHEDNVWRVPPTGSYLDEDG